MAQLRSVELPWNDCPSRRPLFFLQTVERCGARRDLDGGLPDGGRCVHERPTSSAPRTRTCYWSAEQHVLLVEALCRPR